MNISKIEKASQKYVFLAAVIGLTLFAGAKHGSPTNTPPVGGDVLGAPQSLNNAISLCGDCISTGEAAAKRSLEWCVPGGHALPSLQTMVMLPPLSTSTFNLNLIPNWTARGAYCDWKRIDFPDTFAFPSGTNLLTGAGKLSTGAGKLSDPSGGVKVEGF